MLSSKKEETSVQHRKKVTHIKKVPYHIHPYFTISKNGVFILFIKNIKDYQRDLLVISTMHW